MTIEYEIKVPEVGPNADAVTSLTRGRGPRRGNLESLLKYWRPIMKKPGGFRRCVVTLMDKPQFGGRPQRICAWLHHELTGKWPNEGKRNSRRGGGRRRRSGTARRVRRAAGKDVSVDLMSIKSVARDSREFGGVLVQPIAGRQAAVEYKAAMFLQSEQGINAIRVKKVGAFAAGSRVGEAVQGAGSYVLPGDFSDIRSPIRAQIYETLTPGSLRLRRPNFGLPSVGRGRRERGSGARNKFRCPPGFEKGGTFTNSNFSTCGAQILAIPKTGPGAFSAGAERDLARLAESADLVRQIGDLRNNRSAYDIIRAAQIPVAPKKGSDTLRQTAIDLILSRIGSEEFGSRVVRRDGVILENVVPFNTLAQFDEFDDFVDGSLVSRYTSGQIGIDSVPTLTTGLRDVFVAIDNEGAVKVSRVGGELKPDEMTDLRRLLPTLGRRSSESPDPSKAIRDFAERYEGRISVEFGQMRNNRFTIDDNKNELISVTAPGRGTLLVPLWVYETFLARSAPRRSKGDVAYERVNDEKTARLFSIQGKSSKQPVVVGDPAYFKNVRARGNYAASFFDVEKKVTLSRSRRRLGRSIGETGGSVTGRGSRAIFDNNISRFRCPPGTRYGGRITDQFGRNCGYSLPRRIVNRIIDTGQAVEAAYENRNRSRRRDRNDVEVSDEFVDDLQAAESSLESVMDEIDGIVDAVDPTESGNLGPSVSQIAAGTGSQVSRPPNKAWLSELQKLRNLVNNEEFEAADIGVIRSVFQRLERAAGVEAGRLTVTPPKSDRDRSFTDRVQNIVEEMLGRIVGVPAVRDNRNSGRSQANAQTVGSRRPDSVPELNVPRSNDSELLSRVGSVPEANVPEPELNDEEELDEEFLDLIEEFHARAQEFNVAGGGRTLDFFASMTDEEVEDFLRAFQDIDDPETYHVDIIDRFQAELELRRRSDSLSQIESLKNRAEEFRSQNRTDEFFEQMDDVQLRDNYDVLRDATNLSPEEREFLRRIEDIMNRRGILPNEDQREAQRWNMARWAWNGRKRRQGLRDFADLEDQRLDNVAIQAQNDFQDLSYAWQQALGASDINDFDVNDMRRFLSGLSDGPEKRLWVSRYNDWLELSNAVHAFRNTNDREMHLRAAIDNLSRLSPNRRESLLRAANADGPVELVVPDVRDREPVQPVNVADEVFRILNRPEQYQRARALNERDRRAIEANARDLRIALENNENQARNDRVRADVALALRNEIAVLEGEIADRDLRRLGARSAVADVPMPPEAAQAAERVAEFDWRARRARREQQRQSAMNRIANERYQERSEFVPTVTREDGQVVEGREAFELMSEREKSAFLRRAFSHDVEMDAGTVVRDGVTYRKTITPEVNLAVATNRRGRVAGVFRFKVYKSTNNGEEELIHESVGNAYPEGGFERSFNFTDNSVYHDTFGISSAYDVANNRRISVHDRDTDDNLIDFRGGGFASNFNNNAFIFYKGMGLEGVDVGAAGDGRAVWPAQGFRERETRLRLLNSVDGVERLIREYDLYESAIQRGERPPRSALLARMALGSRENAENVRSMYAQGVRAKEADDVDNLPGHHDYMNAMLPVDANGRLGRNTIAFNLFRTGDWDDNLSDADRARLIADINGEMPEGIVLADDAFVFDGAVQDNVKLSAFDIGFNDGRLDLTNITPPRLRSDTDGGFSIVQPKVDTYERFLDPSTGRALAPGNIPIGSNGMDISADAVRFVKEGGSLADVPNEFLKDVIEKNASRRGEGKRFKIVGSGGGVNGMTRYLDQETGQYIGIKFGGFWSSQRDEAFSEALGAALAERFGLAQGQIRFDGKGTPEGRGADRGTPAIVVDLAQNYVGGDVKDAFGYLEDADNPSTVSDIPDAGNRMRMLMMDMISGNTDRHRGNFMYALDTEQVIPIDNGFGFAGGRYRDANVGGNYNRQLEMENWLSSGNRDRDLVNLAKSTENKDDLVNLIEQAQATLRSNQREGGLGADIERVLNEAPHAPIDVEEFRRSMRNIMENYEWFLEASPNEIYGMLEAQANRRF